MMLLKVCSNSDDLGYSFRCIAAAVERAWLFTVKQSVDRVNTTLHFQKGDRAAFLAVYDEHADRIRRLVRRFFPSRVEQEDAAQEVWLVVHRMRHNYQLDRGPLGAWLVAVAANRCRQILRDQGRRPPSASELAETEIAAEPFPPESDPWPSQSREALAHFAASLPSQEATFLRLAFVEELTNPQLARALQISERRCKYLRKKLLLRAAEYPAIRAITEGSEP